jgi:hypothetical protein
MKRSL